MSYRESGTMVTIDESELARLREVNARLLFTLQLIEAALWQGPDGETDSDKEWTPDTLEDIAQYMRDSIAAIRAE